MTDIIDDERIREDADKIVKLHSLMDKLFPDKDVFIDRVDGVIKWSIIDKSDKWKSK